ncbi:hypothetical protein DID88_004894 [Monilinia fructigena]|uniref:Uncharacterized protein n=1 Tax=Monilinia fructigena TaxID=38457 RepID=A0A395IRV6_9HELO|nr:hypothetical protein DID88_004894 [Monilinia fructigena]
MRPPPWLLAILIIGMFSFLGIADYPGQIAIRSIITLTSIVTTAPLSATPSPIVITKSVQSSLSVAPTTDEKTTKFYVTAAVVVFWTSYPPDGGNPIVLSATDYRTWSLTTSPDITFATIASETDSAPIPDIRSISQTISSPSGNIVAGLTTSKSASSTIPTSKLNSTPVSSSIASSSRVSSSRASSSRASSSKDSSSATASGTFASSPPHSDNHKSTLLVAIVFSVIMGSLFASAGIWFLIWCLRRRSLKKQKTSDPTELSDRVFDGQAACKNTGNRVTCSGGEGPQDRRSIMDTLGLTDKKLWPSWPFGDKVMGTATIKNTIMGAILPISSAPPQPFRLYEAPSYFVARPPPAELHANFVPAQRQRSHAEQSAPGHGVTHSHLSGYDENHSTELHGAGLPPSTPTTTWIEPGSSFSVSSSNTSFPDKKSNNDGNGSTQTAPSNWVEPTTSLTIFNRNRSFNAVPPTTSQVDSLRTVAERDNALALLEGREAAYTSTNVSSADQQQSQRQFIENSLETRRRRSEERHREIAARFPFAAAPLPGTVSDETHDVSYTRTERGARIERVNKDNGHGGWM